MKWLGRLFFALFGANLGAAIVAVIETRQIQTEVDPRDTLDLFLSIAGVSAPVAWLIGLATFSLCAFLEPSGTRSPVAHLSWLRALPVLARSRVSALLPLAAIAAAACVVISAHVSKLLLSDGAPRAQGAALALSQVALVFVLGAVTLAASSPLRRLLARAGGRHPILIDPAATFALGLALAGLVLGAGIVLGDTSGEGPLPIAALGVLKRPELDLSPISHAGIIAIGAYVGLVFHAGAARRSTALPAVAALIASLILPGLTLRAAHAMNARQKISRAVEKSPAVARIGVLLLRRATDRDKDGRSALFGGLDCDDRDPSRSPDQYDVPGNGIDEDCSGADTPKPVPVKRIEEVPKVVARPYNVVLITIDTLRADVGFLGYPKPVTPNLDKLAESSTVFEHAYAMASYTGKSIGPMLIGKYPSETLRDGSHFNKYGPENVFVTERLHDAGVRTFGCAGHWYWKPWSGVTQGMDVFDLSAIPPGMSDNDTTVSGDRVSDVALKMLADDANTKGPFFMWIHYFDPHAQYVGHPGAPDFRGDERGGAVETRAAYDNEVWFTDKQVGRVIDAVQAAPFAKDTAIIVTADHGEAFGEHNMLWHGAELWEMLVHVPLLVYVPDAPGHRVTAKRSHIDLAPTILDLENVKRPTEPGELDGVSLLPDVRHKDGAPIEERDVYMDMPPGPWNYPRRAIISGPAPGMKLIHLGGPQYLLFDLATDPGEKNDLSADKDKVQELVDRMGQIRAGLKEIDVKPDSP